MLRTKVLACLLSTTMIVGAIGGNAYSVHAEPSNESILNLEDNNGGSNNLDNTDNSNETTDEMSNDVISPIFEEERNIEGISVSVKADAGVFPRGSSLSVAKIDEDEKTIKDAVDDVREDGRSVALSYSFDIKVLDNAGNEIEPDTSAGSVKVSFDTKYNAYNNLDTDVYHLAESNSELVAEKLDVVDSENTSVTVETAGFSIYTVEFTYKNLQYVMKGDTETALQDILDTLGLSGEISNAESSNPELFAVSQKDGIWIVSAKKAFSSEEWMKVTVDGVEYLITVTDDAGVSLHNPVWSKDSDGNDVVTWDVVEFGNYWQNDTNKDGVADQSDKKEPIKWRVLSVDSGFDNVYLLADKILDCQPYNEKYADVTWETSTLRKWLNETFIQNAFSSEEQSDIAITLLSNDDNPARNTPGGNGTNDQVFCLDIADTLWHKYGFSSNYNAYDIARAAKVTKYAANNGCRVVKGGDYDGNGTWWLTSPGSDSKHATYVSTSCWVGIMGYLVNYDIYGVRPSINVRKSSKYLKYVGTVSSNSVSSNDDSGGSGGNTGGSGDNTGGDDTNTDVRDAMELPTVTGVLYQKDDGGEGHIDVECDERWFGKGSTKYSHDMCRFACSLATMAYTQKDAYLKGVLKDKVGEGLDYNDDICKINDPDDIVDDKDPMWINTDATIGQNKAPGWLAYKTIKLNGQKTHIVTLIIRGTYNEEWIDNFDPGQADIHQGFQRGADYLYQKLVRYIKVKNLDKGNVPVKILVTGHSRGAAVANLLGKKLDDEGINNVNIKQDGIFVYTFATPNVSKKEDVKSSNYNNIYNIVNPEDFVTKVMPAKWGYGRYGTTYVLPSKTTDYKNEWHSIRYKSYADYRKELEKYWNKYRPEDMDGYSPYLLGIAPVTQYVSFITSHVRSVNSYYNKLLGLGGAYYIKDGSIQTTSSLHNLYTFTLGYFMSKDTAKKVIAGGCFVMALNGYWGAVGLDTVRFFLVHEGGGRADDFIASEKSSLSPDFGCAHRTETYMAAINALRYDEGFLVQSREVWYGIVNCPVDIKIKDNIGNVVGQIVGNEVVDNSDETVTMYVEGDSKRFFLPKDADFNVEITGNDTGTMDYSLCEIDPDIGEISRVYYRGISVNREETYFQEVASDSEVEDIELLDSNSTKVMPTSIFSESELGSLNVKVTVEGDGTASGFESLTPGDYVELEAITDNDNDFVGWYDKSGELITKNDTYSFSIKKNESFIARFAKKSAEDKDESKDDSVSTDTGDTKKSEVNSGNDKGQQSSQGVVKNADNSKSSSSANTSTNSTSGNNGASSSGSSSGSASSSSTSGGSSSSSSSSTSSTTTDNTIIRGKGTDKAAYIKTGKGTVKYVKPTARKKAVKITVPDTIKIKGKSYKVTAIEKGAFKGCKKLRSVIIGKNVKIIGREAFSGCKKLKMLTVKALYLKKKGVKDSLKDSYISAVTVPEKKKTKYSKIFTQKNTKSRGTITVK